jgi:hypothetical protein
VPSLLEMRNLTSRFPGVVAETNGYDNLKMLETVFADQQIWIPMT